MIYFSSTFYGDVVTSQRSLIQTLTYCSLRPQNTMMMRCLSCLRCCKYLNPYSLVAHIVEQLACNG